MDARATREALKEQHAVFEVKLEHSRTAARVQLKDQEQAIEHKMTEKMEERIQELTSGGENALYDSQRKVEELTNELTAIKMKIPAIEDALNMANKQCQEAVRRAEVAEESAAKLEAAIATVTAMLSDEALSELKVRGRPGSKKGKKK